MQYNTARELMKIKEYGRGVQDMVKHLKTIEDKEKRQRNAEAIIETMSMLTPLQKNIEDYKHTLWDHLFLIAGYELDVESPYGIPTQAEKQKKPEPIKYPKTKIKWNHFGAKFEKLYNKAIAETDPEKKAGYIQVLALFMRVAYSNWHLENIHDDMIKDELNAMSKGQLVYDSAIKFADTVDVGHLPTINPIMPSAQKPFKRHFNNRNNNASMNLGMNPNPGNRNPNNSRPNHNPNANRNNKFNRFKKK